jgi:GLPGLI family protein
MIRIIVKITIAILLLISSFIVNAQEFQGKAVYQTKIKMGDDFNKRMDSSKMSDDRKAFMKKMIKKRMEKVYELDFTKTNSIFKEQKSLEAPSENTRFNRSANDVLFKDVKNNTFVNKKETFGKVFLITDSITDLTWKLEKETKMIGNYLCLKATTEKVVHNNMSRFRRFSKKSKDTKADSTKVELPKKTKITAWYSPEIPVSNGPKEYGGLPGLILQLDAGNLQMLCTKIVLNPKEKAEIIEPTKGKKITQKEYDKVVEEKVKEMRARYKNNRKKGGSSRRHGRF